MILLTLLSVRAISSKLSMKRLEAPRRRGLILTPSSDVVPRSGL
jgi:hypothetical protein